MTLFSTLRIASTLGSSTPGLALTLEQAALGKTALGAGAEEGTTLEMLAVRPRGLVGRVGDAIQKGAGGLFGLSPFGGKKRREAAAREERKQAALENFFKGTLVWVENFAHFSPVEYLNLLMQGQEMVSGYTPEQAKAIGMKLTPFQESLPTIEVRGKENPLFLPSVERLMEFMRLAAEVSGDQTELTEALEILRRHRYELTAEGKVQSTEKPRAERRDDLGAAEALWKGAGDDAEPTGDADPTEKDFGAAVTMELPAVGGPAMVRFVPVGAGEGETMEVYFTPGKESIRIGELEGAAVSLEYRSGFVLLSRGNKNGPVLLNHEPIPPYTDVPLAEGDSVEIGDREFILSDHDTLARVAELEIVLDENEDASVESAALEALRRMTAIANWRQRVIAAEIARADSVDTVLTAISRASETRNQALAAQIRLVAEGKAAAETLPTQLGIRKKISELNG